MANNITITVCKHTDGKSDTIETISTGGYAILYLVGDKIRVVGDIDLKAMAPLLMKLAMDKLANSQ